MVRHKMNKTMEHGRSMTEMLGVLAIIGTLSISGIAGYTYAMNKHRANEIISSVSKMAMTATTEIDLHGNPSLVEFKKGGKIMTDNGYEVVLEDDPNNGIFRLKVQNVPEAVCDKIFNADFKLAFNVSPCASGDNEVAFSFYDSLSNNVDDTPISDTDSGNTDSPSSGAVSSATQTATTTPLSSAGSEPMEEGNGDVAENGQCTSDSMCQSGLFCQKQCNSSDNNTYDMNPGYCLSDSDAMAIDRTYNGKNYVLSIKEMTQDQAIRWCQKQNVRDWNASTTHKGELVSLTDIGCTGSGTSWSCPVLESGNYNYIWTTNIVPLQSCRAFLVYLTTGDADYDDRDDASRDFFALCK